MHVKTTSTRTKTALGRSGEQLVNQIGMNEQMCGVFFIDGHTHLYPMYDLHSFLDGALKHVRAAAEQLACGKRYWGCLLFSETARDRAWADLSRQARQGLQFGRWSLRPTAEEGSLLASRDGEDRLILVAGRQIQTAEGLEVLALFCESDFPDGLPLQSALAAARAKDAIAVLPWGFGKWWFGRGRLLHATFRSAVAGQVALGDNGGRPMGFAAPRVFRRVESAGGLVLPGSDTLPFTSEAGAAAHYGFMVEGGIDPERPGDSLKRLVRAQPKSPPTFGRRIGLAQFARNQIRLRLRRRVVPSAGGRP
jgi:hypothetical protein